MVNPGDIVIVRDGVYTGTAGSSSSLVTIRRSGTAGRWITFKAEEPWGAVLDGVDFSGHSGIGFGDGVGYIRIEGFDITRWLWAGIATYSRWL
jgi:hypothetical protein